jgi:hypothetical protein
MSAAAIVECGSDSLRILASTRDGLLWELTWRGTIEKLAKFETRSLLHIERITTNPRELPGQALLSSPQGIYRFHNLSQIELIQRGAYRDAVFLCLGSSGKSSVVAATWHGEVIRLDERE